MCEEGRKEFVRKKNVQTLKALFVCQRDKRGVRNSGKKNHRGCLGQLSQLPRTGFACRMACFSDVRTHHSSKGLLWTKHTLSLGSLPARIQNCREGTARHSPHTLLDLPEYKLVSLTENHGIRGAMPGHPPLSPMLSHPMLLLPGSGEGSTLPSPLYLETPPGSSGNLPWAAGAPSVF